LIVAPFDVPKVTFFDFLRLKNTKLRLNTCVC
jgi:hypothetical protein